MYNHTIKYLLLLLFAFISLASFSCREEVIAPINFPIELNNPVQVRDGNTYTFSINAENNSSNITDNLFSKVRVKFYMSVTNYNSGSVEVNLIDNDQVTFYSNIVDNNVDGITFNTEGYFSNLIKIQFKNFTGNLLIQVAGS